jgi:hypothetical protein
MQLPASILLTALVTGRPTRRDFLPFDYIFWDTQERYYSGQVLPYLRVLFDDSPVSLEDKGDICRKYHQNSGLSGTRYPRGRGRRIVMDRKVCQEGERAGGSVALFSEVLFARVCRERGLRSGSCYEPGLCRLYTGASTPR